jgi:5-carboxymethyl-2-hydroxymuconic-semialdehyde dehydrogenase
VNKDLIIPTNVTSFVDGQWLKASDDAYKIPIIHPSTEEITTYLVEADIDEVAFAALTAKKVFESGIWSKASVDDRKSVLLSIKDLILKNKDIIAHMEVTNTGAPIAQAYGRQIPRSAMNFEFFAEFISQVSNPIFDQNPNFITYVKREPVGVAGLIAPWNAPMALASMKIAGAIAFGNSCVFKPSELTPLGFIPFMELLSEAGLPNGVVNMVNGRGEVTGNALTTNKDIDVIAFTGGTETGRIVSAEAGRTLKKTVTELGGKSANIIFEDADLERAVDASLIAIFSNNGQQCLAGSRILVHEKIKDVFIESFSNRAKNLKIGDPFDHSTEIGPIISKQQFERINHYSKLANESKEVQIITGAKPASEFKKGYYFEPTVVLASSNKITLCQEEIFGPFATILTFTSEEEAYSIANDSQYGLVSYVWSTDIRKIMRAQDKIKAGVIWVNTPLMRELRAPFGGYKNSGIGRDGGKWSRNLFTEEKTVSIPLNDFPIPKLGVPNEN